MAGDHGSLHHHQFRQFASRFPRRL
jgi:hypothetical protein